MRATGLRHLTQKFEVGGVTIQVRLDGEHAYIAIGGKWPDLLSGVVDGGELVLLPPEPPASSVTVLRAFKPTASAQEYVVKKTSPPSFVDSERLSVVGTTEGRSQYEDLQASMFSGKMAKIVQIVLGYGRLGGAGPKEFKDSGVQVQYKSRWSDCHGIVTGADGNLWLTHISSSLGVRVMPLPTYPGSSKLKSSRIPAVKKAAELCDGLPTGLSFPTGEKLTLAMEQGRVLQLISAAGMAAYFGCNPYSEAIGWTFNESGSEAHNCCWSYIPTPPEFFSQAAVGRHYKLAFNIGAVNGGAREPGEPIAEASAALTLVHEGALGGKLPIHFGEETAVRGTYFLVLSEENLRNNPARVFVAHIAGVLKIITLALHGNVFSLATDGQVSSGEGYAFSQKLPSGIASATSTYQYQIENQATEEPGDYITRNAHTRTYAYLHTSYDATRRASAATITEGNRDGFVWHTGGGGTSWQRTNNVEVMSYSEAAVVNGFTDFGGSGASDIPWPTSVYTESVHEDGPVNLVLRSGTQVELPPDPRGAQADSVIWGGVGSTYYDEVDLQSRSSTGAFFPVRESVFGATEHYVHSQVLFPNHVESSMNVGLATVGGMFESAEAAPQKLFSFVGYIDPAESLTP